MMNHKNLVYYLSHAVWFKARTEARPKWPKRVDQLTADELRSEFRQAVEEMERREGFSLLNPWMTNSHSDVCARFIELYEATARSYTRPHGEATDNAGRAA